MLDEYILNPTIRLVVNNQVGTISGAFWKGSQLFQGFMIFAHKYGSYTSSGAPSGVEDDTFIPFENTISSTGVDNAEGNYIRHF